MGGLAGRYHLVTTVHATVLRQAHLPPSKHSGAGQRNRRMQWLGAVRDPESFCVGQVLKGAEKMSSGTRSV
jgi:hypothetical protein